MDRRIAHHIAEWTAKEVLPILDNAIDRGIDPNRCRVFLREVRDKLHTACGHFEGDDACEEHDDIYVPLFDALSYLSAALFGVVVELRHLVAARDLLRGLCQPLQTV